MLLMQLPSWAIIPGVHPFYFVVWFSFALLLAGIAQGKNRSGLGWFFLGVVLGPVALIGLVFAPKLGNYEDKREEAKAASSSASSR